MDETEALCTNIGIMVSYELNDLKKRDFRTIFFYYFLRLMVN
jgi:hypothetical protein